ncbi:MAG: DNA-processing protein DprA [Anaerolineaceae bacterium]|jgi:DNA processing protein|nr:DNA-processing protein DprA [Anaerolineaceae bacterium]
MDPRAYWLGFNLVKGIGSVRLQGLLNYFGSLEIAWQSPPEAFQASGLSSKVIENLVRVRGKVDLEAELEKILSKNIQILTWESKEYPRRLKEIDQPPPVLYVRGDLTLEDEWAVAIVGTRRVTAYGRQMAEELAGYLAGNGITVVSGLARGVDGLAHKAALAAGGRSIAVLGSGVDHIYPPEHRNLADEICANGAVISDYAPGTPPEGVNFPPRNRIISGLSLAVIVVEAGKKSGALITAKFAADQGRDVFAIPGNVHAPQSIGTNQLIQDGARPLLQPKDVLEALNLQQIQEYRAARHVIPSDEVEAKLIEILRTEPVHVDELSRAAGYSVQKVSAALTMLELKGVVRQVGGMQYVMAREVRAVYETGNRSED